MNIDYTTALKLGALFLLALGFTWGMIRTAFPKPDQGPTEAEIESYAKVLYSAWSTRPGFKPWVDGGNSMMQDKARAMARKDLESQS